MEGTVSNSVGILVSSSNAFVNDAVAGSPGPGELTDFKLNSRLGGFDRRVSRVVSDAYSIYDSNYDPLSRISSYDFTGPLVVQDYETVIRDLGSLLESPNEFGYYVGATHRRQSTVDSMINVDDSRITFYSAIDAVHCKWISSCNLSVSMEWHPLWNKTEFMKRVRSGSLYSFQKSPGLEEPIVFTFCSREPIDDVLELKMNILGLHRPGVTFRALLADGVKFAQREPRIDVKTKHWCDAIFALRDLLTVYIGRCRLSGVQEILDASDHTTSPGFPSNLSVRTKGGAMTVLTERTLLSYMKGRCCCMTSFFCCFVRTQVQSRTKDKNRVILATDSFDQFALMHVMLDFMNKFTAAAYEYDWPFTVGDSVFYGGPNTQVVKLYGRDGLLRLGDSSDVSGWDGSLPGVLIKLASLIAYEYVDMEGMIQGATTMMVKQVYDNLIDSIIHGYCIFPWGEILLTEKGMKSGTFVTALFNSLTHWLIRAAAFFQKFYDLTEGDLKILDANCGTRDRFELFKLVRMSISGDDNRSATPAVMRVFWPPSLYSHFYRSLGMIIKDSSTSDTDYIVQLWSLPYNSRIYPVVMGRHVVYRPADVLWASVAYPERESKGAMSGPYHESRLLARCVATYLEGFMNIYFRRTIEIFVFKVIPPTTVIDWNVERGFRKRLSRLGLRGVLPRTFPSRQFAWNLHMPDVVFLHGDHPGVEGSDHFPGKFDHLFR